MPAIGIPDLLPSANPPRTVIEFLIRPALGTNSTTPAWSPVLALDRARRRAGADQPYGLAHRILSHVTATWHERIPGLRPYSEVLWRC
jgi:hypothetical protein